MTTQNPFLPDFDLSSPMPEALYKFDDLKDPRYLVAHFLMGEVYLGLSFIDEFANAIKRVESGELPEWKWSANMFSLEIGPRHCTLIDFEAEPAEDIIKTVRMSHGEFLEILDEWKRYVGRFELQTF